MVLLSSSFSTLTILLLLIASCCLVSTAKAAAASLSDARLAWGGESPNVRQNIGTVGVIVRPTSLSNCTCVAPENCNKADVVNQGEGVINPRHECASNYVCCIFPLTARPATGQCGVSRVARSLVRVVNPRATVNGEFPWMVALLQSGAFLCGGTLISSRTVMTAAHCVSGIPTTQVTARVGEWDASTTVDNEQDLGVSSITIHPDYRANDLCNDLALITLTGTANTDQVNVGLSCLPNSSDIYLVNDCVVTGWGKDAFSATYFNSQLKKVRVPLVSHSTCQTKLQAARLGNNFRLDTSMLCAGQTGSDACTGDGGGPLLCPLSSDPAKLVQVGIVSWGLGCGDTPGVYTDVGRFTKWIRDNMAGLSSPFTFY